ncbi:MAG: PKD domain-containing protein, partial [bacterium]|nr:PKD domain-containing protein [bacterium]
QKEFKVIHTVTDNTGATAIVAKSVIVSLQTPPAVDFSFTPESPNIGDEVRFTPTVTKGAGDITSDSYYWDFGDGQTSRLVNPVYDFPNTTAPTVYNVLLIVTDTNGQTGEVIKPVTIGNVDNVPPVAAFSYEPQAPQAGDTVQFLSESTDDDGTIVSHQWEFGDGGSSTNANPSHTYKDSGNYVVTLTVTDNQGGTGAISNSVPVNTDPTAFFTYSPGSPESGEDVTFDGSGSSDGDGDIRTYTWDFGDGTTGTGETASHTYTADTTTPFTVTLTVTDDLGGTGVTTRDVTVLGTNVPPVASFTFSPAAPTTGTTVFFNASSSTDEDGSIASYSWDFGNGSSTGGVSPSISYGTAGTYTVTLTVTDDRGGTNTVSQDVTVT